MLELAGKEEERGHADGEKVVEEAIPDQPDCLSEPLGVVGVHCYQDQEGEEGEDEDEEEGGFGAEERGIDVVVDEFGRGKDVGG